MTADYDFWSSPNFKEKWLKLLEAQKFEVPARSEWKRPILSVYAGVEKIDLFFIRKMVNREGKSILFQDCLRRSVVKEDPDTNFRVRIPSIDDLIALKKMERKNKKSAIKDSADLFFLEQAKQRKTKRAN